MTSKTIVAEVYPGVLYAFLPLKLAPGMTEKVDHFGMTSCKRPLMLGILGVRFLEVRLYFMEGQSQS